jgi:hypothetical protein
VVTERGAADVDHQGRFVVRAEPDDDVIVGVEGEVATEAGVVPATGLVSTKPVTTRDRGPQSRS